MTTGLSRELDVINVLSVLWRKKLVLLGVFFCSLLGAFGMTLLIPDRYESHTLVKPVETGVNSLGAAAGLGGLASFAGIDLAGGRDSETTVQILRSRSFALNFIKKYELEPELVAAVGWDSSNGIVYDPDIFYSESNKWVDPNSSALSDWSLIKAFHECLEIHQNEKTKFIDLYFHHYSPDFSAKVLSDVVKEVNNVLMERDVSEAERSLSYLYKQVNETSIAEMKPILFDLIEEQLKTIMLAEVRDEYALSIVDPVLVPEKPAKPLRVVIAFFFSMFSVFVTAAVILCLTDDGS